MTTPWAHGQFAGKTALITGAGQGIGRATALVLAGRGAAICVTDLNLRAARKVADEVSAVDGRAVAVKADVTDPASLQSAVDRGITAFGSIDICVANAGVIAGRGFEQRADFTDEDWSLTRDVNVFGTVNTVDAVAPHMRERRSGRIVIISSQGGRPPRGARLPLGPAIIPYLVSKAATIQLTHHLAIQLGPHNINVNAVCPGTVWTPMWERLAANRQSSGTAARGKTARQLFEEALSSRQPLDREQTPEDIGRVVAFLASDDASQITGQAINVNGGAVMG
jgi:NAD(P)-dependent dehydrogenase (short-subunit alcohol dehydrogenase family)